VHKFQRESNKTFQNEPMLW